MAKKITYMKPMPQRYPQAQIARSLVTVVPLQGSMRSRLSETYIARGQPIFKAYDMQEERYLVTRGEVAILRDGWPVDLVECGEVLDRLLWPGTTAVALRDCTLATIPGAQAPGDA